MLIMWTLAIMLFTIAIITLTTIVALPHCHCFWKRHREIPRRSFRESKVKLGEWAKGNRETRGKKKTDSTSVGWKVVLENERKSNRTLKIEAYLTYENVQRGNDVSGSQTGIESTATNDKWSFLCKIFTHYGDVKVT